MKKLILALAFALLLCVPVLAWNTEEQKALDEETGGRYQDYVIRDNGGKYRLYKTIKGPAASDYAERYYRAYFASDDQEVHFIVDFARQTTTRLSYAVGSLFVDTFSYVKGEENDANIMPGGDMLDSQILDIPANDYTATEAVTEATTEGNASESAVQAQEDGGGDEAKYTTKKKIKKLQKALRARGYYSGEVTGKLDEETRKSIRKFQASNGMESTGYVTKELYKALV